MPSSQADKEKDVDELDGEWEDSDSEETNEFRVRDPLNPPAANLFSTQALHSMFGLIWFNYDITEEYFYLC